MELLSKLKLYVPEGSGAHVRITTGGRKLEMELFTRRDGCKPQPEPDMAMLRRTAIYGNGSAQCERYYQLPMPGIILILKPWPCADEVEAHIRRILDPNFASSHQNI